MTKKDLSHFKYYIKRLKAMGFRDIGANDLDWWPIVLFDKHIGEQYAFIGLSDFPDFPFDNFPNIKLVFYHDFRNRFDEKPIVTIYKIGFDKDFQKNAKSLCSRIQESTSYRVKNINEYPTWRSAFNQLVADYHDLETNTQRGFLMSK